MKINEEAIQISPHYKTFYNCDTSYKLSANNKFNKYSQLTPNLFKNHELRKSLSIKVNNNNKSPSKVKYSHNYNNTCDSKNSFLTIIPINTNNKRELPQLETFYQDNSNKKQFYSLKKNHYKKNFELKCFNDEHFFNTSKPKKAFLLPKNYFIIKQYRVNHDTNAFNLQHVLTDYTKKYERNSYKIKKIIQDDMFTNKIKKDLLKLKFNNRIKPFDDL